MMKFLEKLGSKYFIFFRRLNLISIILILIAMIYLRGLDLYYLMHAYNENMAIFWYFIIVLVISSLILLIILSLYYLKNGINLKRGTILAIIFILSPLLTISYAFFSNNLGSRVTGFFTQSLYISLIMIALSYAEGKISNEINGT